MSITILPVSATMMIPLSAAYRYDDNISFLPERYEYDNGYQFIHQPIFNGTKDIKFANESFFGITSAQILDSILSDLVSINPTELVFYTSLKAGNNLYVTNIDNNLYATATTVTSSEFFRISRNIDGTCSISQNNLYATIVTEDNDFSIIMTDKLESDPYNLQKFVFYTAGNDDIYTIKVSFYIPEWSPWITTPIERFVSFNDSYKVKTIGMVENESYTTENNYRFYTTLNLNAFIIGYDAKVVWVKYYNEILNKFFNRTTDIQDIIEQIQNNYLIEYPYKAEIDNISSKSGRMNINLITLKNILTPEYRYAVNEPRPVENIEIIDDDEDEEDFEIVNGIPDGKTFVLDGFVNGGFEDGTFNGWTQTQGYWDGPNEIYTDDEAYAIYGDTTPYFNNCEIVNSIFPDLNAGGTLTVFEGNKAARVNDGEASIADDGSFIGTRWSTISQTVTNWNHDNICFSWNAVLEDPYADHGDYSPRFRVKLFDETTSTVIYDVNLNVLEELLVSGGWKICGPTDENRTWKYSDWQTIVLKTSLLIGHNLTLSVAAYDCAWIGHGGYVYVDNFGYVE